MVHIHYVDNIPLCIQAHGFSMNEYLERKLHRMVTTLKGLTHDVNRIDVRMEELPESSISPRTIFVHVRLAGAEIKATDSGRQWKSVIKHVAQRLNRQLEKRSALIRRQSLTRAVSLTRA